MTHHKKPLNLKVDEILEDLNKAGIRFIELLQPLEKDKEGAEKLKLTMSHLSHSIIAGVKLAEYLKGGSDGSTYENNKVEQYPTAL